MRLAFVLASLLAIGFCGPVYPPTAPASAPFVTPEAPQGCLSCVAQVPLLAPAPNTKPSGKSKPQPPKPDALPTYELAAAVEVVGGALQVDVLR